MSQVRVLPPASAGVAQRQSAFRRSQTRPRGLLNQSGRNQSATSQGAAANKVKVDTFVVYTDNETWAGSTHPHQALRAYRDWSGIDARLVVAGLTATDFTIADPADPGMLDIAGFDAALPALLTDFSARAT
jgi:hypothetical protein